MMENWQPISVEVSRELNDSVRLLHQAAQFVAMFSNSYLPAAPDDSQNCLFWKNTLGRLESRRLDDFHIRMALDVKTFELIFERPDSVQRITLDKRTKKEINDVLLEIFPKAGLNIDKYKPIRQFTIPHHAIDDGMSFNKPAKIFLDEWARYLGNSQHTLKNIATRYGSISEICVWPHHFDMAILVPVDCANNETRSIGMGLAIADAYVAEPYFYINNLDAANVASAALTHPKGNVFWNTKDWLGLVLPASAVAGDEAGQQEMGLRSFFMTAWMHHAGYVTNM